MRKSFVCVKRCSTAKRGNGKRRRKLSVFISSKNPTSAESWRARLQRKNEF